MTRGPPYEGLEAQHKFCPKHLPSIKVSWCKFQKDKVLGTSMYDKNKCLPFLFRGELKPIFDRLSSQKVLGACERGLTQNQNESLNNVVDKMPEKGFLQ